MENLRRFFSIFEVMIFFFKKLHSGKTGASESKEIKLKLVWPKHTNILFIFSFLFFRYSNMITFLLGELGIIFAIGLQCMCIEQVKTETNNTNCLVKLNNCSCVFMSSA